MDHSTPSHYRDQRCAVIHARAYPKLCAKRLQLQEGRLKLARNNLCAHLPLTGGPHAVGLALELLCALERHRSHHALHPRPPAPSFKRESGAQSVAQRCSARATGASRSTSTRAASECGTGRRARESSTPRSRGRRATSAYLVLPQQALNAARASARGMLLMRSIVRLDMNPRLYVAQRRGVVRGDFTTHKKPIQN